jgi:transposase InsO family protein
VPELIRRFGCSQRNALRVVAMSASTYLYRPVKRDESVLKMRIKEITQTRLHYGYRRVHVMRRREGHHDNVKRVYRIYRQEGLSLRLKRLRRSKAAKLRQPKQLAHAINEIWSMDFVADEIYDGRKLRMLTVVGVPERALVHVPGRCAREDRSLADRVRREPSPLCARLAHTHRIRPPMCPAGHIGAPRGPGFSSSERN